MSGTSREARRAGKGDGDGVVAALPELVRCRPDRRLGGFAPAGKVTTHQAGAGRSVFGGRGMEFDEARVYRPGDDIRAIDWCVTARTGKVHTKLFREERERPVSILVDCRPHMHFGTRVRFKSVLAARLAATLSWVALDGGDRVGGLLLERGGLRSFRSTRDRRAVLAWLRTVGEATRPFEEAADCPGTSDDGAISLAGALRRLRRTSRPGALVFVVGDFVDLDDAAEAELARLALHAHVTNILVYDALEETLPARGDFRISDGVGAIALDRLSPAARRAHERALAGRRARLERLARRGAMAFVALSTADDPASVLGPRLARRRRRRERTRRRGERA